MRTVKNSFDIEDQTGHHELRRHRAETRGSARHQTKQVLLHLTRAARGCTPFAEADEEDTLQFAGALPAEVTVE